VPFVIVFPGIMAVQLYGGELETADQAYPILIRKLIPSGLRGFMFAAIAGAVISSLGSMLNSASTVYTMDLYKRHLRPAASQGALVWMGRAATVVFVVIGCLVAPYLAHPRFGGVFNFIQEFQGYISPGILAAFVFGFIVPRAPGVAGVTALLASAPIYGFLQWQFGEVAYLNRMAITFGAVIVLMTLLTVLMPLKEPKVLPEREDIDTRLSPWVAAAGMAVIAAVAAFYVVFW
jgi:solute:Na+ symporter, SSS family